MNNVQAVSQKATIYLQRQQSEHAQLMFDKNQKNARKAHQNIQVTEGTLSNLRVPHTFD